MSSSNEGSSPDGYQFTPTQDWFSFNIDTWKSLFTLVDSPKPRVLEIGSWEGRSAVFLLSDLCVNGGEIVCIDHFDLMNTEAGKERYRKITHNLSLSGKPFRVFDEFSFPALMAILEEEMTSSNPGFDWIYVDGSHEADDTFLDGELAWRLARKGCIFIFDDYNWDREPKSSIHHPRRGIDAFLTLHDGEYERISTNPEQYQMVLKKTSDMRIGFLVKEKAKLGLTEAFGYGINIALTVESSYAMPAAVTIRSAVERTKGRITVYVIDCGLSNEDKGRITESVPARADVTILFLQLHQNNLTADLGVVWAKVDMLKILPVERVLYLDSDTLIRSDLNELWNVDLESRSLAAAADVGFPLGHDEITRGPYFNAGILLIDLAKVRMRLVELETTARQMKSTRFLDQDAFNIHFAGDWTEFGLKWNAQGLGTYADSPSAERTRLRLEEMKQPNIVHFSGPLHPELAAVLNPWVQPCTSKPWGYAGAPGHPFKDDWWTVLERTAWNGWKTSSEYREICEKKKNEAIRVATENFRNRVETV